MRIRNFFYVATLIMLVGITAACSRVYEPARVVRSYQTEQLDTTRAYPRAPKRLIRHATKEHKRGRPRSYDPRMHPPVGRHIQTPMHQSARVLASHETEFNAKETNRANNIARAAQTINRHIVHPGEVFSYNETVGPTNERRGYKKSTIYMKGEKKEGVGGGVCQVSTTLFNAAEDAGMTILERHDHSLPVTYAESGEEAATSYGGIDLKFRNDKHHAVRINAQAYDGKIKVEIAAV